MSAIDPVLKYVDSFTVTGLTVRTQNSDEFNPETAKLPGLWQQFYSGTPNLQTTVYGVYSGYESDANGYYDVTAGTINDSQDTALDSVKINSGNYLVFCGKGEMPQIVIEAWQRVWDYFASNSSYQRCFMTDFEEYKSSDEVAVFIGIR